MSDAELVRQALAGRPEAFAELVRRWAGRITALCHARVGCAAAADDLAQDALLRAFRALGSLDEPAKFGPWLCQIAQRTCLNWLKARKKGQILFSELSPDQHRNGFAAPAPEDPNALEDDLHRLRQEVAALPEECRQVLQLYYHEKVTYRELADLLGVSAATVNARLTRARMLLRERLGVTARPDG